jgi:hypothetical protein
MIKGNGVNTPRNKKFVSVIFVLIVLLYVFIKGYLIMKNRVYPKTLRGVQ